MERRSAELRRRHRRVLLGSVGVAVLLHVAVFALAPGFRAEPAFAPDALSAATAAVEGTPVYVTVDFGPPEIFDESGELVKEERTLEADHVLALPRECGLGRAVELPVAATVRMRVWRSGRTDVTAVVRGTGSDCGDAVVTEVADALHYRWLPSERHPAPVDLLQPVTLRRAKVDGPEDRR